MKTTNRSTKFVSHKANYKSFFLNEEQITRNLIKLVLKAKIHLGQRIQKWNPKMSPYVSGKRKGNYIFNLEKTLSGLSKAIKIIQNITAQGGTVLFVNTDTDINNLIIPIIPKNEQFAIISMRWVGGTLTNWNNFQKFFDKFYKSDIESLTKSQLRRFIRDFKGLEFCKKQPDLVVFFNCNNHAIGIQEATNKSIPIIAITDSDSDPRKINFKIPGNVDNMETQFLFSQLFILSAIKGSNLYKQKNK